MQNYNWVLNLIIFAVVIGGPIVSAIAKSLGDQARKRRERQEAERQRIESLRTGDFAASDESGRAPGTSMPSSEGRQAPAPPTPVPGETPEAIAARRRAQLEELLRRRREQIELEMRRRQEAQARSEAEQRAARDQATDVTVRGPAPTLPSRGTAPVPGGVVSRLPQAPPARVPVPGSGRPPMDAVPVRRRPAPASGPAVEIVPEVDHYAARPEMMDISGLEAIEASEIAMRARSDRRDNRSRDPMRRTADGQRPIGRPAVTGPQVIATIRDHAALRQAIVLSEVLGPPLSLRDQAPR